MIRLVFVIAAAACVSLLQPTITSAVRCRGRIYSIVVAGTDAAGNTVTETVQVSVPLTREGR